MMKKKYYIVVNMKRVFIKRERIYKGWIFICEYCLEGIKKKYEKSYEYVGTRKSRKK